MNKQYLYIEPYTLFFEKDKKVLLYNTMDQKFTLIEVDGSLSPIVEKLKEQKCIEILPSQLENKSINRFVEELRAGFNGDILPGSANEVAPAVFHPVINNQRDFERLKKVNAFEIDGQIMNYLEEIYIYLNGMDNNNDDFPVYQQIPSYYNKKLEIDTERLIYWLKTINDFQVSQINLLGGDVLAHSGVHRVINVLLSKALAVNLYYKYDLFKEEYISLVNDSFKSFFWVIPVRELKRDFLEKTLVWSRQLPLVHWLFLITSEEEYYIAETFIEENGLALAEMKPVFTGDNLSFFQDVVFMDEADIQGMGLIKREVYVNQKVNRNDFGRLTVLPTGDIYANPNFPYIGKIGDERVHSMIYREMIEGHSWLRIRNQEPCCSCIYQWFCPSPSNYELAIGRPNLCHIKS